SRKIVKGVFGLRLVVDGAWSDREVHYLVTHKIRELAIGEGVNNDCITDLEFLADIDFLEGLSVTNFRIKDLRPINQLKNLRMLFLNWGV
ncbi:hypothetical protein ABTM77_20415, partial [Acinetobacter baumannii]